MPQNRDTSAARAARTRAKHERWAAEMVGAGVSMPIIFTCSICKTRLSALRAGALHVSVDKAMAYPGQLAALYAERSAEYGIPVLSASDLTDGPQLTGWHVRCDEHMPETDTYWIGIDGSETEKWLLLLTAHLCEKEWFQWTDWSQFLYSTMK